MALIDDLAETTPQSEFDRRKATRSIDAVLQAAERGATLTQQLLAFSRKQTLQPRVHVLTEALSDLGNLLSRVLGEKVALKITHDRDLGLVLLAVGGGIAVWLYQQAAASEKA